MTRHQADVIIVGAGLSGLYAALLIDSSRTVDLLVKSALTESNSNLAQGGIAAELNHEKRLIEAHIDDTIKAGSHLNDVRAVRALVNEAHENIHTLLALGVAFDTDEHGTMKTTREGGHRTPRVLHSGGDQTGKDIINALHRAVKKRPNITVHEHTTAIDLIVEDGRVHGLSGLDHDHAIHLYFAPHTVLATGGIGAVYAASTNSPVATGDGIAMALRAGVRVEKMAFIQFHPTAFFDPAKPEGRRFLISEAVRGDGAVLRNIEGDAFMKKYHPDGDLAPRDIVSQAIHREMYDTWCDHVTLDTRHLDTAYLSQRFPTIHQALKQHGITLGEDLIPVAPVQHFTIGGIKTDLEGRTTMPGLYALGECASTGVHGANRLASNSLLECVVFGRRIAESINQNPLPVSRLALDNTFPGSAPYNYAPVRKKLGLMMEEHVGIVRTAKGLTKAKEELSAMRKTLVRYPNRHPRYHETLNMITVALAVVDDALARPTSIGAHFRIN